MTKKATMIVAMVAMLAGFAILPVAASGAFDVSGRGVAPTADLKTYFWEHGVHPQYLGMLQTEIPSAEWMRINEIVREANVVVVADAVAYTDDHDTLNRLVYEALSRYPSTAGETLHLTLGNTTWSHKLDSVETESTTDIYGSPASDSYPTPRS